jgi:hypothetical protein
VFFFLVFYYLEACYFSSLVFLTLHCYLAAFGGGCCFEEVQIIQEQCETGLQDWECSHFCCCTWYVFVVDFDFSFLNLWGLYCKVIDAPCEFMLTASPTGVYLLFC